MSLEEQFDELEKFNNESKTPLINNQDICMSCFSTELYNDNGIISCMDCGIQKTEVNIDHSPEWTITDGTSSTLNRCSCKIDKLLPKTSIATRLVGGTYNMRQTHNWSTYTYREISLIRDFSKMHMACQDNAIPQAVVNNAKKLYKGVSEVQIKRGDARKGLMAACVYIYCEKRKVRKSRETIANIFAIDAKYLSKGINEVKKYIHEHSLINIEDDIGEPGIEGYAREFCIKLRIYTSDKYINKTLEIARQVEKRKHLISNMSKSLAAGCLHYVAIKYFNNKPSKSDISKVSDLSEVTIVKCYNNLLLLKK